MAYQVFPTTKAILCLGDSITFMAAARAPRGYPPILDEMLFSKGYTVGNNGISGGGYRNARDAYELFHRNRGLWGVSLLVGVNDIAAGETSAQVFEGIKSFVDLLLADGLKVILGTILPWKLGGGWTLARQTVTEEVNAQIRALAGTHMSLKIIDGYAVFGQPDDPTSLQRTYQEVVPDLLHLGSYGAQVYAELVATGLAEMLAAVPLSQTVPPPATETVAETVAVAAEPDTAQNGTDSLGIHQSDVIIRTALVEAIAELRANPDLLDWVFASLRQDELTSQSYGDKEIEAAKKWFLATQIPVVMVPRLNEAKVPCLTIKLVDSNEDIVTLGDVHYDPIQNIDTEPLILVGPTAPIGYTASTGLLKFSSLGGIYPSVAMSVYDRNGVAHPIVEVLTDLQFKIAAGTVADFSQCTIRSTPPPYAIKMESVRYKETYQIGIHVSGEPVYLTWLHSILVFILLRSKQRLLEARGYESTTFNSTDFDRNEFFEAEFVFSRYINITGYVRHYWPKSFDPTVTSVESALRVIDSNLLPADTNPNNALWIGEHDFLTPPRQ